MLRYLSRQNLQNIVYQNTPLDRINVIQEGYNFLDVQGSVGNRDLTYRIYENGKIEER